LTLHNCFDCAIIVADSAIELYEICLPHTYILCSFALFFYPFLTLDSHYHIPYRFQSTPPTKEATIKFANGLILQWDFNPRLQQRRRPRFCATVRRLSDFNPRLQQRRRLCSSTLTSAPSSNFNPRLQQRRRRVDKSLPYAGRLISIHASNKGGDYRRFSCIIGFQIFQSTPPTKEATSAYTGFSGSHPKFQSTPPTKEATISCIPLAVIAPISIHASNKGGDEGEIEI